MEEEEQVTQENDEFEDEETSRELVVPGEVLTEDVQDFIPGRGTIFNKDKTKIISLHIGLKNINKNYINVIPLRGIYTPQPGDKVIAIIVDKNPVKYKCDINAKDFAQLKPKNTVKRMKARIGKRNFEQDDSNTEKFDIGDYSMIPSDTDKTKWFDIAAFAGAGIKILFITVEGRYHWGLLEAREGLYNRYFQLGAAISF